MLNKLPSAAEAARYYQESVFMNRETLLVKEKEFIDATAMRLINALEAKMLRILNISANEDCEIYPSLYVSVGSEHQHRDMAEFLNIRYNGSSDEYSFLREEVLSRAAHYFINKGYKVSYSPTIIQVTLVLEKQQNR